MYSVGRVDLGLSEPEFWALSPRTYRAMLDRKRAHEDRAETSANLRAGVIASAVLNSVGGKKNGGQFTARDFFHFEPTPTSGGTTPSADQQKLIEGSWLQWAERARTIQAKKQGLRT
jgi:hypothetical protein